MLPASILLWSCLATFVDSFIAHPRKFVNVGGQLQSQSRTQTKTQLYPTAVAVRTTRTSLRASRSSSPIDSFDAVDDPFEKNGRAFCNQSPHKSQQNGVSIRWSNAYISAPPSPYRIMFHMTMDQTSDAKLTYLTDGWK